MRELSTMIKGPVVAVASQCIHDNFLYVCVQELSTMIKRSKGVGILTSLYYKSTVRYPNVLTSKGQDLHQMIPKYLIIP